MKAINRRTIGIGLAALAVGLMFSFGGRGKKEKGALNFFIISDWGWNGFKAQQEVADQMARSAEKIEPSFVISTGDNFQVQGVASVQDPLWITNYENVYKSVYLQCDWYPVLGNHDYRGNTQAQIEYSKISRRWRLESRYYTLVRRVNDSVSARFIFLDTSPFVTDYYHKPGMPDIPQQDTAAQMAWLRDVLANSKEQWKLVFGHHPVFSGGKTHGSTPELIERFRPLFEQYHVQVYFSGHDHDLQHLKEKGGSVDYLVDGAGGEPRPTGRIAQTVYSASMPAFSTVSLWGDSIRVRFVDSKGKVVYGMGRGYR